MKSFNHKKELILIFILVIYISFIAVGIISSVVSTSPTSTNIQTDNSSYQSSGNQFTLLSDALETNNILGSEYTCDGAENSPPLSWNNVPAGTKSFVILMSTVPVDEPLKYSWVIYNIPASSTGIPKNNSTIGTYGMGDHKATLGYQAPCSQGPGEKIYTVTIYALSEIPTLPEDPDLITGTVIKNAILNITISSASIDFRYSRVN